MHFKFTQFVFCGVARPTTILRLSVTGSIRWSIFRSGISYAVCTVPDTGTITFISDISRCRTGLTLEKAIEIGRIHHI